MLILSPMTMRVTTAGLTELLPASSGRYKIYTIQFISAKSTRELTLFEGVHARWQGELQQDTELRIDFGNLGWEFKPNTPLFLNTSGSLTLDVNLLQYGLLI